MIKIEVTEKQADVGSRLIAGWLDDPEEGRCREAAVAVYKAMLAVVIPPDDIEPLQNFRDVFVRAAEALRAYHGESSPDAIVMQKLADSILPTVTR
jgi:hypothetical protein